MDPTACNYDPTATANAFNWPCYIPGKCEICHPQYSWSNPPAGWWNWVIPDVNNDACQTEIPGCTDTNANNFDPTATIDDGSCTYDKTYDCVDIEQPNREMPGLGGDPGWQNNPITYSKGCVPNLIGTGQYQSMGGKNGCKWNCKDEHRIDIPHKIEPGDLLQERFQKLANIKRNV